MNRIFKNMRNNMVKENRIGKYLLYALGEIILVILGILIALQINNRNEQRKNEAKIEAIFLDIKKDILVDIAAANRLIERYETKDSLMNRVLDDSVTLQDYAMDLSYFSLITTYVPFKIKDNGYSNLMRQSDFISSRYDSIIPLLDNMYLSTQASMGEMNEQLSNHVTSTLEDWSKKYTWFLELNRIGISKRAAEYFLTDSLYKNQVVTYQTYSSLNLLRLIKTHKLNAILAYRAINNEISPEEELPKIITDYFVDLPKELLEEYEGHYEISPNFGVDITIEEGDLYAQATNQGSFVILPKSDSLFFSPEVDIRITFKRNGGGKVTAFSILQNGVSTIFRKTD